MTFEACTSTYTINFTTGKKLQCEDHIDGMHAAEYQGSWWGWTTAEED